MRSTRRFLALLSAAILLMGTASAATPLERRARLGVRYLVRHQEPSGAVVAFSQIGSTADAVASMVAARRAPDAIADALAFLEARLGDIDSEPPANQIGLRAKVVLAVVAAGGAPRDFGGHNLVQEIASSEQSDGRYGAETPVFGHALAVLALTVAGEQASAQAVDWLLAAQCRDGGWEYQDPSSSAVDDHCHNGSDDDFFLSDTNTTSLAVQALAASESAEQPVYDPFAFFDAARDDYKHGWVYDPSAKCTPQTFGREFCMLTDANSTAMVIQAYAALGRPVPARAVGALKGLQYKVCGRAAGAFAVTWEVADGDVRRVPTRAKARGGDPGVVGATIAGILGLLQQPLPVPAVDVTRPAPRAPTC